MNAIIYEIPLGGPVESIHGSPPEPSALSAEVGDAAQLLIEKAVTRAHSRTRIGLALDLLYDQRESLKADLAQAESRAAEGRKLELATIEEHKLFAKSLADQETADDRSIAASIAAGELVELPEGWGHGHAKLAGLAYSAQRASAARKLLEQVAADKRTELATLQARIVHAADQIVLAEASAEAEVLAALRAFISERREHLAGIGGDELHTPIGQAMVLPEPLRAALAPWPGEILVTSPGRMTARDIRIVEANEYWQSQRAALIQGENV